MISAPERCRNLALGLLIILLAGCGPAEVVVQGEYPRPLIEPVALHLGVWYDEEFAQHVFFDQAKSAAESSWRVKTGQAQVQMWDTLLSGMFTDLVHLSYKPTPGQPAADVDAVLIPHVDELQYSIPAQTNVKVYEIWMRYRFELVKPTGDPIADWTMPAYGKTPTAFLQSDEKAVNLAAVMALRDAGANFATSFNRLPAVRDWLASRQANNERGTQ